jgi:hypothetical protein
MASTFERDDSPLTIRTAPFGTSSTEARSRTMAVFAAPSTGGALTRQRKIPSTTPSIASRSARGVSLTGIRTSLTTRRLRATG